MVKFGIQPKKISTALQLLYFVEKGQLAPASMMVFDTKNLDRKNFLATVDRLVCPVPGTPNLLVGDDAVLFACWKKISSSVPLQNTSLKLLPSHEICDVVVYGWSGGAEVFSICVRKSSSCNPMPRVVLPRRLNFFR